MSNQSISDSSQSTSQQRQAVTAVIADDEPLLRFHLNKMLAEVWPELEIRDNVENGLLALEAISQHQPDVVFLDIRMPNLDGIALAAKVNKMNHPPMIVFVTAYDEYAVAAFEKNALDYLLKPIEENRLLATCQKVQQRLQGYHQQASLEHDGSEGLAQILNQLTSRASGDERLTWIKAMKGEELHLVSVSDVLYFKAEDKYVSVITQGRSENQHREEYIIRTPLKELLAKLDPDLFWQIHRSVIVNVSAIEKVSKGITGKMQVHVHGSELPVSRGAQSLFKGM